MFNSVHARKIRIAISPLFATNTFWMDCCDKLFSPWPNKYVVYNKGISALCIHLFFRDTQIFPSAVFYPFRRNGLLFFFFSEYLTCMLTFTNIPALVNNKNIDEPP